MNRSLIKIVDGDKPWMHDLLSDLGRNIVDEGNGGILGRRGRLWSLEEAFHVVQKKKVSHDFTLFCWTNIYIYIYIYISIEYDQIFSSLFYFNLNSY